MSNLWFFRVRSCEQHERRRSSGEQSIGNSTINSAHSQQASSDTTTTTTTADEQQATNSKRTSWQQKKRASSKEKQERKKRQTQSAASTSSSAESQLSVDSSLAGQHNASTRLPDSELGVCCGGRPIEQITPQVTIVRSDSTSSTNFVPLVSPRPTDSEQQQQQQQKRRRPNARSLVSRLSDLSGRVETELGVVAAESDQQFNANAVDQQQPSSSPAAAGRLHDQLDAGKVPPINQRRLLQPDMIGGVGVSTNLADSLDNLAALIPR